MNRITKWRHKTGRSKNYAPKGEVDYFAVSIHIARRFFIPLWREYKDDVVQECHLIALEASRKKYIKIKKRYGNSKDRIGIKAFSKAVSARLYQVSKNYGFYKPRGSFFSKREFRRNNLDYISDF